MGDRQRMIRQRHVELGERAPAAADQIEGPPFRSAAETGRADRLRDLAADPLTSRRDQRLQPKHAERRDAPDGLALIHFVI